MNLIFYSTLRVRAGLPGMKITLPTAEESKTSLRSSLPNFFYRATRRLGQFAPALRPTLPELVIETFLPADALPAAAMQPLVTVSVNPYAR